MVNKSTEAASRALRDKRIQSTNANIWLREARESKNISSSTRPVRNASRSARNMILESSDGDSSRTNTEHSSLQRFSIKEILRDRGIVERLLGIFSHDNLTLICRECQESKEKKEMKNGRICKKCHYQIKKQESRDSRGNFVTDNHNNELDDFDYSSHV
jgi:hypothetical protein